jgi:tRNA pseudouridine55 synthase
VNRLSGILLVDKPPGPTSHDVVDQVREAVGMRKVGHAGTLDPFASGLLLLLLGPATRLSEYLLGLDKSYRATVRLGIETSTHDPEGEVVREDSGWKSVSEADLGRALAEFRGTFLQTPPRYSSKKVGGEAAHRRVRRGEEVTLSAAEVVVHEILPLHYSPPEVGFHVRCSSGTYVRALARDLGRRLGVGAHLTGLVRTDVGSLELGMAAPLGALTDAAAIIGRLIPPALALAHLPAVEVSRSDAERIRHGQSITLGREGFPEDQPVRILLEGDLLAMGGIDGERLRPRKVLSRG